MSEDSKDAPLDPETLESPSEQFWLAPELGCLFAAGLSGLLLCYVMLPWWWAILIRELGSEPGFYLVLGALVSLTFGLGFITGVLGPSPRVIASAALVLLVVPVLLALPWIPDLRLVPILLVHLSGGLPVLIFGAWIGFVLRQRWLRSRRSA
jgi:hypothetical protein